MKNSKSRGSPGFQKQGKCGKDSLNRFHAISLPDFEDYDECFPALSGAKSKAPIKELNTAVNEPSGATDSTAPVNDWAEEGRRLERASYAQNPNKKSPLEAPNILGISAPVCAISDQVEASLKDHSHVFKIQTIAEVDLAGTASAISDVGDGGEEDDTVEEADVVGESLDSEEEDEDEGKPREVADEKGNAKGETFAYGSDESKSKEDESGEDASEDGSITNAPQRHPQLADLEKQKAGLNLSKNPVLENVVNNCNPYMDGEWKKQVEVNVKPVINASKVFDK
ncbi:hypothetical protein U1Q18_011824, partial [Sarracenia purpurea var. burkii]